MAAQAPSYDAVGVLDDEDNATVDIGDVEVVADPTADTSADSSPLVPAPTTLTTVQENQPFDDDGDGLARIPFDGGAGSGGLVCGLRSRLRRRRRYFILAAGLILLLSGIIVAIVLGTSSSRRSSKSESALAADGEGEIGLEGGAPSEEGGAPSEDGGGDPEIISTWVDTGSENGMKECPEDTKVFAVQHNWESAQQLLPNLFAHSEVENHHGMRYTWSLLDGCSHDVIATCQPCPEGVGPDATAAVQMKQAMNEGGGNNLFQLNDQKNSDEFVRQGCLSPGSEYILEIKPIDEGDESNSCCGLSNPASASFTVTYNEATVASIKHGVLEVGTGGHLNNVLEEADLDDLGMIHHAMTPSACRELPRKRCRRTVGCDYNDDEECVPMLAERAGDGQVTVNVMEGTACRQLTRDDCKKSAVCYYDGEDDSCSLALEARDVDRAQTSGPVREWSISFGESGSHCEGGVADNSITVSDTTSGPVGDPSHSPTSNPFGRPVDTVVDNNDTVSETSEPVDDIFHSPTSSPSGRSVETMQPAKASTDKPTSEPITNIDETTKVTPVQEPTKSPTAEPSIADEDVDETTTNVTSVHEPITSPSAKPSTRPTPIPSASPSNRPIDDSPAISCPAIGSPWTPLASDTRRKFQRAAKDVYCGIFVDLGGEGGALIPFARSYNGEEWEASPGPYASPSDGIDCNFANSGGDECAITLPELEAGGSARYIILSKDGTMDEVKQIARFLEMTTFGPRKDEIRALSSRGEWGPQLRAEYIREQMDLDATSHREYFRRRANAKFDTTTTMARSDHPCSPNSLWRKYAFVEQDAQNRDGSYVRTTFEVAEEERGSVARIYEADGLDDVSDCENCGFENVESNDNVRVEGYSGAGFYNYADAGDFIEWRIEVQQAGRQPVSFRFSVGKIKFVGRRPLDLYVNDALIKRNYMFGYTGSWSTWHYSDLINVRLEAGSNKIKLLLSGKEGPHIDHLRVGKPPTVLIKSNGHLRTVAKAGVHPAKRWLPDYDIDGTAVWFPKYPEPPRGQLFRNRYGRLNVALPSQVNGVDLDIGNPPVDFTGYESHLPGPHLQFTEEDVFVETASQLHEFVLQAGQELLLRDGSTDPICDTLPRFADEDDPPVFGLLPSGEWLQWTPRVLLEQNGPSVNTPHNEIAEYTLEDGLGATKRQAGVGCANVPRSPFNENTCFLSTSEDACSPVATDADVKIPLTESNIAAVNDVGGRYVYAVKGLVLEDLEQHPCLARRSRWAVQEGACPNPNPVDDPQDASSIAIKTADSLKKLIKSSDDKKYVRDVLNTEGMKCDPKDVTADKLGIQVRVGNFCYTLVHPDHLSVYEFSGFAAKHPGGEYNIKKWAAKWDGHDGWYINFPNEGDEARNIPQHQMDFWDNNKKHLSYVGRLGDDISYSNLPADLKTEAVGLHFGIQEKVPKSGTIVCGSVGEVSNDPALGEVFNVGSDDEVTTPTENLNNQKQVVWTEVNLYAKDQLRQRMAWALAQMITTVPSDIEGEYKSEKFLTFYDIFVRRAFGSYLDILRAISYSPIMAEQLSYLDSKSHAFVYSRKDRRITKADENFAREIMQLFSVGLLQLNDDGTPKLDPATGNPLETYTNDDIESLARAWTGFTRTAARGNIEGGTGQSELDPLQILPAWRDAFPKHDLDKGYIGDRYPLCQDLQTRSFLRKGARYRLLGGTSSPELIKDPSEFADDTVNSILRAELVESSELYQALYNGGKYELTVELGNDLNCYGIECQVDTVRVVKVGSIYYEFVQPACVQMAFFEGGKKVQLRDSFRNQGQFCANPVLPHARESCCRHYIREEVQEATMEAGVTHMYDGERMTYKTAKNRCAGIGKDVCTFRTVIASPNDDDFRKGNHWTDQDCSILMKVNPDGHVAIVHDIDKSNARVVPLHVRDTKSLNYFKVFWNGDFPGSNEENSCASNKCQTMDDGSCLCNTKVVESTVFDDMGSISKADVTSQLFIGALGPPIGSVPGAGDGFTAHISGDRIDESTVFEILDKGRRFFLKNVLSTVSLGKGWDVPPTIFQSEDATVENAEIKSSSTNTFVSLSREQSYIEWTVDIENSGSHSLSLKYALHQDPTPVRVFINGAEIIRQPKNPTIGAINLGRAPVTEELERCEGNCNKVDCAEGLFCVNINNNWPDREIPGCDKKSARAGWDYCADPLDYTHALLLLPTGSWAGDWRYSDPIEASLAAGTNVIRVQAPRYQGNGPNIDFLKIEAEALATNNASTSSFRNPPHFMSLIDDAGPSGSGEQTLRDAQYETEAVLQHYFYNDNVAPFVCTRIMQRFGHSNPSRRYVSECTRAFRSGSYNAGSISFGSGEYGSLESLVASIVLDREANDPALMSDPSHGSLREPIVKVISLMRSMEYKTQIPNTRNGPPLSKDFQVRLWKIDKSIGQGPYEFPTIFSFLLPEYVADSSVGLVSPESELATMPNTLELLSGMFSLIRFGLSDCEGGFSPNPGFSRCPDSGDYDRSYGRLFYQPEGMTSAEEASDLSLLLTAGRLSESNVDLIVDSCASQEDKASRTRCMQQLIVSTAEFHSTNRVSHSGNDRSTGATVDFKSSEPYRALIFLFLSGGVDSYNLLAPHTCAPVDVYERYRKIRGKTNMEEGVGLPLNRLLPIDANNLNQPCSRFGIHEELTVLKELYDDGKLAFIANAGLLAKPVTTIDYREGTPVQLFSHNGMQLETKKDDIADKYRGTGIAGRLGDVLRQEGIGTDAFSIKGQQILLLGERGGPSPYTLNKKGLGEFYRDPSVATTEMIKSLNKATTSDSGLFAEIYSSKLSDAIDKHQSLKSKLSSVKTSTKFPPSDIGEQFKLVTELMQTASSRGVKRDIFYVADGGYDTHSQVDKKLANNFSQLNPALDAFVTELKALDLWESTTLMQFSEFGRTLEPNTGDGTDHGWAGNQFVFGGSVRGGRVLGKYPDDFEQSISNPIALKRGRMIPTYPWDSMWTSVAEWMGVPANSPEMDKVLPMRKNFPDDLLYGEDDLFQTTER